MNPTALFRRAVATAAVLAAVAACGPSPPRNVQVELTWDIQGVAVADGHGTLTSDLGYTVDLDRFEVTAYSFEVIPCDPPPPQPPGMGGQKQSSLSFIGTAWAGHRIGHPPTLTRMPRVESPLRTQTLAFDTLTIPDDAYCSGHYLIGRLPETGIDPADVGNVDFSLRVHGRYRKGDNGAWTAFTIETPVSHGILVDLKKEGWRKGVRFNNGDTVVVQRRLGGSFNGVDFAAMNEAAMARQILRRIVASTTLAHRTAKS
jgi:hypothetical protein